MKEIFFGELNKCSYRVNSCILQTAIKADREFKLFNV